MIIKLDMATVVRNARLAFDAGTLQAQQPTRGSLISKKGCLYVGPCVIGVSMTQQERDAADTLYQETTTSITNLIRRGLIEMPLDQQGDAGHLQGLHDTWHLTDRDTPDYAEAKGEFNEFLIQLETKYGV